MKITKFCLVLIFLGGVTISYADEQQGFEPLFEIGIDFTKLDEDYELPAPMERHEFFMEHYPEI